MGGGGADGSDINDTDLTLRHISRLLPQQMLRGMLAARPGDRFEEWVDTQLAQRQRRLDRALIVSDGASQRALHIEWQRSLRAGIGRRMFSYNAMLVDALDARPRLPVVSTVVLLSGREAPHPRVRALRLSELHTFRYYLDAVYQRSVEELSARGTLWLAFAPLARDATPDRLRGVVRAMRRRTQDSSEFSDLAGTLLVLADADGRRRGLRRAILPSLPSEVVMQSWVFKQGIEKGIEQGIEQGIEKGIEQGLETGLALVVRQFERKLSRALTEPEHRALRERLVRLGGARLGDLAFDLDGPALERWLADPAAR